jgi:outer membrane protein OmpA-like peptidoglycan-associated protein
MMPTVLALDLDSTGLVAVASQLSASDSLECLLQAETGDGTVLSATAAVPIERTQSKFERSRLSLVVFDFDRADLSPINRQLVQRFVLDAVKPSSRIRIVGSTDRLGEALYNLQLSQARADEARRYIQQIIPTARIEEARGIGSSQLLFDNATPEGRYYCRTVTILVETPIGDHKPTR